MLRICLAVSIILSLSGCSGWQFPFEERDNFQCGVREGDKATYCDGNNERCVCATTRCAVRTAPASNECPTGYVYRFEPRDCVDKEHVWTMLARNDHETYCPQVQRDPPRCGLPSAPGNIDCSEQEFCVCGVRDGGTAPTNFPRFICARLEHDCQTITGEVSLADRSGQCLGVDPRELVLLRPGEKTCPGADISNFFPDAGADPSPGGGTNGDGGTT
jgi:hypothetical protein